MTTQVEKEIEEGGIDSSKNYESKIWGTPSRLHAEDLITDYQCMLSINGDDFDRCFTNEPGIFSDGVIYAFFEKNIKINKVVGKLTFQFT